MRRRIFKCVAGFTLTEMMIAVTLGMIVIAGVTGTFNAQTRQNSAEEQVAQLHQNVRGALDMIIRDLMQAGYKSPSSTFASTYAWVTYDNSSPQVLTIKTDLDANNVIDNTADTTTEYIVYTLDSTNKQLTRKLGSGGTANVAADNITSFTISFYDSNGASTTTSSSIRKLSISITGETATADPSYNSNNGKRQYSVSADVTPPNLAL